MKIAVAISIIGAAAVGILFILLNISNIFSPMPSTVTIQGNAVIIGNGTHYRSPDDIISFRPKAHAVLFIDETTKTYSRNETRYDSSDSGSIPHYEILVQNDKSYLVLLQYWFEYWHYYCSVGHVYISSNSPSHEIDLDCDASGDAFDIYTVLQADPS